jgi:predicted component of type VI protein secretion system
VARFNVATEAVRDSTADAAEPVDLRVGRASLRLVLEGEAVDDCEGTHETAELGNTGIGREIVGSH